MGYKSKWSGLNEATAREYYFENFEGMSRTELQKKDRGFYKALQKRGLLDILPESKNSNHRDWSGLNEDTARDHYLENYEGLSRSELVKEGNGFYEALRRKGLMDILPESTLRDWSFLNEETARAYYLENYEGLSRKELENEDGGFYGALRRKGLLDTIRPFYNMQEFQEHLEESGLLEDLFNENIMVKDVTKFSGLVKEYCEYNCQSIKSVGDELGMKTLKNKLNPKSESKLHPEEIEKVQKYMENPDNDRWKEYSLESEL